MIGQMLGHYQVAEKLGAGGMGEVYRARDTRLGRDVALKFLPASLAQNPQALARFEREAQLLASLNHPNIAAIYGFENVDGVPFLVLEYVPGENLKGPMPVVEALEVAGQITAAMEEAHGKGIVHRDLKPANIKITPEGKVKVLDFGLAKALADEGPAGEASAKSPTLSVLATRAGTILGTAAYMSPEQARGKRLDKRTDVWSFGCVLYEVLTGRPAFGGESITDVLAAVVGKEPDWSLLPPETPAHVRRLLRLCLEKDAGRRLRDIGDAWIAGEEQKPLPTVAARKVPWAVAPLAAIIAGLAVWLLTRPPKPAPRPVTRLSAPAPANTLTPVATLSRDGTKLAYFAGQQRQIHLRHMDQLDAKPIPGTDGAWGVLNFSPDGQWVVFSAGSEASRRLKKVQVVGGAVITLCDGGSGYGVDWGRDGNILFSGQTIGLQRVSAAGGKPEALTTPDAKKAERNHSWPHILPGGEAVLFTIGGAGSVDDAKIAVLILKTREQRVLVEGGTNARYVPGPAGGAGYLVYARAASLFAVPFDLRKLQVVGSPVPVLEGVSGLARYGFANFSFSDGGTLVYVPGGSTEGAARNLVWIDRDGKEQPLAAPPREYALARLSPDGQRVVVSIGARGGQSDIWLYDLPRGTLTPLTFQGDNDSPVWTPDGKRVTFRSTDAGKTTFSWVPVDGSGPPEPLVAVDGDASPYSWSPDGKLLAFRRSDTKGRDIWLMPVDGKRTPRRWVETQFDKLVPQFSPDGRWLAYVSGGGRGSQVFVQAAPSAGAASGAASGPGARWQVSVDGGFYPWWSRDGRELFYLFPRGGKLMSAPIEKGPAFRAGTPRALFDLPPRTQYDVSPDGKRFLIIKSAAAPEAPSGGQPQFQFVLEWFDEVRRRVQAGAAQ